MDREIGILPRTSSRISSPSVFIIHHLIKYQRSPTIENIYISLVTNAFIVGRNYSSDVDIHDAGRVTEIALGLDLMIQEFKEHHISS